MVNLAFGLFLGIIMSYLGHIQFRKTILTMARTEGFRRGWYYCKRWNDTEDNAVERYLEEIS